MAKNNQSLEQLFLTALQNGGNGILNDPKRFAAVMSDLISGNMDDQDLYRSIFKSRFPTFFSSLNNDQSALADAVLSATNYISNNYHLNEEWARALAEDLGYAIQSYNKMPRRIFAAKPVETFQTGGGGVNVPPYSPHNNNVLPYVLLCVGLAVVIAAIIIFLAKNGALSRKENVDPTEEPAYTQTITPTSEPTETPTPTDAFKPTHDISTLNIENEVRRIRQIYTNITAQRNDPYAKAWETDSGIIYRFQEDGRIMEVDVPAGHSGSYSKEFYYDDDEQLIFAYYEASDSYRYYFYNGYLIRARYCQDKNDYDNAINYDLLDSEQYRDWEHAVYTEGVSYITQYKN